MRMCRLAHLQFIALFSENAVDVKTEWTGVAARYSSSEWVDCMYERDTWESALSFGHKICEPMEQDISVHDTIANRGYHPFSSAAAGQAAAGSFWSIAVMSWLDPMATAAPFIDGFMVGGRILMPAREAAFLHNRVEKILGSVAML